VIVQGTAFLYNEAKMPSGSKEMPSFRRIKDFEYQSFHVVIAERDGWVRAAGYTSTNTLVATVESETAGEAEAEIKGTLDVLAVHTPIPEPTSASVA
jgi:hypothetical protein